MQHENHEEHTHEHASAHTHAPHPQLGAHIHCSCGHCEHDNESHHAHIATAHGDHHHEHGAEEAELSRTEALKKLLLAALMFITALLVEHLPVFAPDGVIMQRYGVMPQTLRLVYGAFYLAAYLTCGRTVILGAARNIARGKIFDEQFLMTVASVGAICLGEFAEAVAVMLFYQVGEFFQDYAVDKSRTSITALMDIRADHATVLRAGKAVQVAAESVAVGEFIEIKPGERVPLDGIVEDGDSFADTSALTGESVPRHITAGSEVLSGFINTQGVLRVRVTKPYHDSAASRILALTEKAVEAKAKTERFITRFARVYTPIVCGLALAVAVIPPLALQLFAPALFAEYGWSVWVYRALLFLVVSCPCALVISVPLSFFSGIGVASSRGILVKGSTVIEQLAAVKTAAFDKTGTLTKGIFAVTQIKPFGAKLTQDELLALAAHAEFYSNHPISLSLKAAHSCPRCGTIPCTNMQELSGLGIQVDVAGETVLAGNRLLMEKRGVTGFVAAETATADTTSPTKNARATTAGTVIYIAVNGDYKGFIVISDETKEDAAAAIRALKKLGIKKTVMLTGDRTEAARTVATALGLNAVYAELLPQDKVSCIEALLAEKSGAVLFVGDGINDSPVLARADVGCAMGALGSDAAIEAADLVIMDDKPSQLADAIRIARRTVGVVWQNIVFALGVKGAVMVLGTLGIANLWVAVFGDVGVAFLCVLNALRLLKTRRAPKTRAES